jgi:hypothetical protein
MTAGIDVGAGPLRAALPDVDPGERRPRNVPSLARQIAAKGDHNDYKSDERN